MKTTYPAKLTVSVWVGRFTTEQAFDRCVDHTIAPLLHLPTHIANICEVSFESNEEPVNHLLEGFSGWQSFSAAAVDAARAKGITSANAALVCYFLSCSETPDQWGEMTFLGSFAGNDRSNT